MDVSGIGLTRAELGLLANRYRVPGGGGFIDYQKFCDQSNKVRRYEIRELTTGGLLFGRRLTDGVPTEKLSA